MRVEKISPHVSIVSPVYQAEALLDELIARLKNEISIITNQFEIILIEDGSRDESWRKIEEHCLKDPRIKGIQLSRNFGQHPAIAAGIESARGEWVIVMDCDLQDRPEEIPSLYRKAQEGYDIVLARRIQRKESIYIRWSSKVFYSVLSFLSGVKYDSTIANFGIYHHKVIHPMMQIQNNIQYFPAMVNWVGFNQTSIPVEHAKRPRGKSSYNFAKKLKLALNIMLAYSDKLLKLIVGFGLLVSIMAFFFALLIVYRAINQNISVKGYASLVVSIFFFSGVIISVLGVLGLYIGKIFDVTKIKPAYLIRKKMNE